MFVDETKSIFVVYTAHKVSGAGFSIFHEVVWHQNLVLWAVCPPKHELLRRLIMDSILLIDAVSLAIIVNTRICTVEKILAYLLALDLPWQGGGQQPGARLTVILVKGVSAGAGPWVVIFSLQKTQPPAQVPGSAAHFRSRKQICRRTLKLSYKKNTDKLARISGQFTMCIAKLKTTKYESS